MNDPLIGSRVLGRYRVVRALARGGMGVVYLGRTEGAAGFARPVVIKRLLGDLAGDRAHNEMFVREARILANLQHPNIVGVLDFGEEDLAYVMVLEYVHGYDLSQWSMLTSRLRGRHEVAQILYITRKVLAALDYAHNVKKADGTPANIVHRDVSLSNVLLDAHATVKLHDFGIARMEGGSETPTEAGAFRGKLALAAPELLDGGRATPASDTYAVAVMLYQLLSGKNPFRGKDSAETIVRVLNHTPPPLSSERDDLPAGLDDIVARALHRDPAQRPPSAAAFGEALTPLMPVQDDAIVKGLAQQLEQDFAAMPAHLEVESLSARDAAWRDAQTGAEKQRVSLQTSRPAPRPGQQDGPHSAPTKMHVRVHVPAATPLSMHSTKVPPAAKRGGKLVAALAIAALGVAALALAFVTRTPAESPTRYLVIEKPGSPPTAAMPTAMTPTAAAASATPSAAATSAPAAAGSGTTAVPSSPAPAPSAAAVQHAPLAMAKAKPAAAPQPPKPDAAALSVRFRRQQPQIETCFQRHAQNAEAHPRFSVRFEVATSGQVESAQISDPAVANSELGRCVLHVARRVNFGKLAEPVAFSIPITARSSQ